MMRWSPRAIVAAAILGAAGLMAAAPGLLLGLTPGPGPGDCRLRDATGAFRDRLPPSSAHWLGTDAQGCDYLVRIVLGARQSMSIGIVTTVLVVVVGASVGVLAASLGGWVDALARRTGDILLGLPFAVGASLILSLIVRDRRTIWDISLALGALVWPSVARVVRARALTVRSELHIEAALASGATPWWIMRRRILPACASAAIVQGTTVAGLLIAGEATLTFLGIGVQVPSVSWGLMIEDAQRRIEQSPHLLAAPAVMLTLVVIGFVLLGDELRDRLDPPFGG